MASSSSASASPNLNPNHSTQAIVSHAATVPPHHILGHTIHSRTRIYVSYLIPAALEVLIYIAQIVSDAAVSYEHFKSHQPNFGWATLLLILVPPVLTFVFVLTSKAQWADPKNQNRKRFVGLQLLQMLLFPLAAIYRFSVRFFWSVEALFHDDDDKERMWCLTKTEECSTCELYHLIQAYGQSAPQIILQLYHMLTQDLFRNYQTTTAQALSLVFSTIDLAAITTSYQRFESQRQVGRHYPWSATHQLESQRRLLQKHESLRIECEKKQRDSQRTISSFPESDKIMANFKQNNEQSGSTAVSEAKTHSMQLSGFDEVDNEANQEEVVALLHSEPGAKSKTATAAATSNSSKNITDDDKIKQIPKRLPSISEEAQQNLDDIQVIDYDEVPSSPAPAPPMPSNRTPTVQLRTQLSNSNSDSSASNKRNKRSSRTFSQLDTFKDMLLVNAQLYIREHVPRPPKLLIKRVNESETKMPGTPYAQAPSSPPPPPAGPASPAMSPQDVVDFFLPRPTKIINGIEQDDFAAKTIAFFGWISFVIMRMLSLATFCVFFPRAFFIVMSVHYVAMLVMLYAETRCFRGKVNRNLFYLLLAYVYLFVLLEFRIKFKHIRLWYIGYFIITMGENIFMTTFWYAREEFESWWFGFIFEGIIYSGILFVATILVYYCILKPKDVTLIVDDNDNGRPKDSNNNRQINQESANSNSMALAIA